MECTWDRRLQLEDELPVELLEILRHGTGTDEQYLDSLTRAALDPKSTYILLYCENILSHICASLRRCGSFASTIATFGRLVPYASFLSPFATSLLESETHDWNSGDGGDEQALLYLLGIFRLMSFDRLKYCKYVQPSQLVLQLDHSTPPARYLIIRILQIYLNGADAWFEAMVARYVGEDSSTGNINGIWDEKIIDYRFLTLWEDDRRDSIHQRIQSMRNPSNKLPGKHTKLRVLNRESFHPSVCLIGGVLLPRKSASNASPVPSDRIVSTPTVESNIRSIAESLKVSKPVLLSGPAGSGKSLLIRYAALQLQKLDDMVTLHLNEQSDAKLLLGIYTTGDTPGSFVWKPGVLTTAVEQGRWVLIEDLDRAPIEVLGVLLPLIEQQELYLSNRKETVVAAEGFRLFATVRTFTNYRNEEVNPLTRMLGQRHWRSVHMSVPPVDELGVIVRGLFPDLEQISTQLMAVYERLLATQSILVTQSRTGIARPINARDFMKWCQRVSRDWRRRQTFNSNDNDNIFLDAVDCFVSAIPAGPTQTVLAATIAEELRIEPQRRDHLLSARIVRYEAERTKLTIGRFSLPRKQAQKRLESSFSINTHTTRMLERVAAAVLSREPLLLVGETGVGKTTAVQHLANHLGKRLVPFNLSQQSEAGDLLGGFKPVSSRSVFMPMQDEFDELFTQSFSSKKNQEFHEILKEQVARSKWKSVCKLWRQASALVDQQRSVSPSREGEAPSKKRKINTKKPIDFGRWASFSNRIDAIEQRVAGGNHHFAFSFIEGNIVKAVRNGDWILLDEINLASADTLEAIADLFDPESPSLLLTEAGSIERIAAHPEFRVFAAMNPATDVGKRDLSPGIRSRFTEIYVESPDKDTKCLQSIVQAYLHQECLLSRHLASDVATVYQTITRFAEENRLVDGAGQKPHFSLRTLTRTLSYAKRIQQMCNTRRALYEGFQMSFMTFLDDESARLVEPVLKTHIFEKQTNRNAALGQPLRKPDDGHEYVAGHPQSKHWIRKGPLDIDVQPQYIITPFVQQNLENLVRAASTRQFPVLIQGPTSSGKTSMIEYLAKRTGHHFVRINNHEHTDLQEYLGTYVSGPDGRLLFQEGVLVKALREGHWVVLDELNLAPTDVLEALNRLLDDNRELLVPETQEVVRPHAEFMLFATQNPAGLYGGRKTLSRAFRNRFLELHFDDIPIHELQEILHRRAQLPKSRSELIVEVYRELSIFRQENRLFEQKSFATLRDLFRWALRPNDTLQQLADNGYMLLCERVRKKEERQALKAAIEKSFKKVMKRNILIDETALYALENAEIQEFMRDVDDTEVVWTSAMRRLYVLVSRAIQNNEPILLVGETGCGKTTVCQMIARALKKNLHMLNAHQNTETGDLIGSQRPVRNRTGIESDLREQLVGSMLLHGHADMLNTSTDALLKAYDQAISALSKDQKHEYMQGTLYSTINSLRTRFQALFEWVDGSLVHALRSGDFFLLDEISLADDSVLERLNSVLEPSRTILLAEKGVIDSSVIAAPGFQFFATMNPGGDYGKRELSPALRNRFTEIWVPALSDEADILQIVHAKLVPAARRYAQAMVTFASWFKTKFDTSANSAISIRDTLAWVHFVNQFAPHGVESSIVHGAAMVYIDTLGANPAGLMTVSMHSLGRERCTCLKELGRLLQFDSQAIYNAPITVTTTATLFTIGPFSLARASHMLDDPSFSFEPLATRLNAMRVLRALQLSKPVMLEGSPGVGKTALVTALAQAIGMSLTRINLSDQTDLLDLFGSDTPIEGEQTGTFVWRDAPFLRAMKRGEWVLLDEMNLASQSVLEGLNACLDHRGEVFVPELGQTFSRHPDFRLFAAQNPHHQGGGRKGLPASFVNRFTVVYADSFGEGDLKLICERRFSSLPPSDIAKAVSFVTKLSSNVSESRKFGSNGAPWEFNLRDISRWLGLAVSSDGLSKAGTARDFVEALFTQRFRTASDRSCVNDQFDSIFGGGMSTSDLSISQSPRVLQIGLGVLPRDPLRATSPKNDRIRSTLPVHLHAAQFTMLCIRKGWPVILSGSPGAGKTSLIEQLAATTGATVRTLSMNAETDSMDLIGGYEQFDPRRRVTETILSLQEEISGEIKRALLGEHVTHAVELLRFVQLTLFDRSLNNLAHLIRTLKPLESSYGDKLALLTETAQRIDQARFEWVDGPLIEAMQQGHWLMLDNANLCSPSVLDRLNSLLEPDGVLMLNEHTGPDAAPRILKPHPNFRVFLTIDPRLGELSRAMRNRAVELHLFADEADDNKPLVQPFLMESAMTRFSAVKSLNLVNLQRGSHSLVAVVRDHFALRDEILVPRLLQQMELGLYRETIGVSLDENHEFTNMAISPEVLLRLETLYRQCQSVLQVPADYVDVQTLHPLNNQPLAQQAEPILSRAQSLATFIDLHFSSMPLAKELAASKSNRQFLQDLDRFLRLVQAGHRASAFIGTLNDMLQLMTAWFWQSLDSSSSTLVMAHPRLSNLISFTRFFFDSVSMDDEEPDPAVFNACLATGKRLCNNDNSGVLDSLFTQLSPLFSKIQPTRSQASGFAYVSLWKALRLSTPRTYEHLQAVMKFEATVNQFDTAAFKYGLPLPSTVDIRLSFQQALSIVNRADADLDSLIAKATTALNSVSLTSSSERVMNRPHFADSFELICQQMALLSLDYSIFRPLDIVPLEALAGRSTQDGMTYDFSNAIGTPQRTFRLLHLAGPRSEADPSVQRPDMSFPDTLLKTTLLKGLATMSTVSLGNLDVLENEIAHLGRTLASLAHLVLADSRLCLDQSLKSLLRTTLSAMSDAQESSFLSRLSKELLVFVDRGHSSTGRSNLLKFINNESDAVSGRLAYRLLQITEVLSSGSSLEKDPWQRKNVWISFAITCLELFISEVPSDPVIEAQVQVSLYQRNKTELESKLMAVQTFSTAWVGLCDSLRSRTLQSRLYALGSQPPEAHVCRPPKSQLLDLLAEFQSLMRILQAVRDADPSQDLSKLLNAVLWDNIQAIRSRLTENFRAYADIAMPVVGFIDCLAIARRLSHHAEIELTKRTGTSYLGDITPLHDSELNKWLSDDVFVDSFQRCASPKEYLYWLSVMAARSSVVPVPQTNLTLRSAINHGFEQFYEAWRKDLTQDQKAAAAKSSLYKYKGGSEVDEEVDADELETLFPTFENVSGSDEHDRDSAVHSQALALDLARLHHNIYAATSIDHHELLRLLANLSQLDTTAGPQCGYGSSVVTVLLSMAKIESSLRSAAVPGKSPDVYRDSNIQESKRLVLLVKKTSHRFNTIHNAWPEHAVPIDVLRICDQILEQSHSEPLMKYLPFVEGLHFTINEWQKIASSEYSASMILEEITNLIVSWRQLELSTWAALFDHEDKQCTENSASWWYIAYETIIVASNELRESPDLMRNFAQELTETLKGFLVNCGIGEFKTRLQMLRNFQSDLATRSEVFDTLLTVHSALSSVLAYYTYFEQSVESLLTKRRAVLENEVRNTIQLASWKDRNIETLKSSSKSSHKKLFKIVRKYRQVLGDPVDVLLLGEFPQRPEQVEVDPAQIHRMSSTFALTETLSTLQSWRLRPAEVSDPQSGAQVIWAKMDVFRATRDAAHKIESFLRELDNESTELRKATPSISTEENKPLVQHLKTRKRRLLADVLKDVRLMGFQVNLGEHILTQQNNTSAVLAANPVLGPLGDDTNATDADHEFLHFLHVIPAMREAAAKPSDELTPAEVARCRVLIESMLHISLEQRKSLAQRLRVAMALRSRLEQFQAFATIPSPHFMDSGEQNSTAIQARVTMTLGVVKALIDCVDIQAKFAHKDYSPVLHGLESKRLDLCNISERLDKLDQLPPNVTSSEVRTLAEDYAGLGVRLEHLAEEFISSYPELGPTLSHLPQWSGKLDNRKGRIENHRSPASPDQWTHNILATTGRMLTLVANGANVLTEPKDIKSSKSWLLDEYRLQDSALSKLSIEEVSKDLNSLFQHLPDRDDSTAVSQLSAVCNALCPIFQAYGEIVQQAISNACAYSTSMTKMARQLTLLFTQLARQGFCTPSEKAGDDEQQSGDVQTGTGLGDGEGGEDISKDIGADEDLSELAQEASKDKEQGMEAEKDAVDMADEEMEGEFDESHNDDDGEGDVDGGEKEDAELDEEAGHVSEDDAGAVDEKMLDSNGKAEQNQVKDAQNAKGDKSEDVAAAEEQKLNGEEFVDDDVEMEVPEGDDDDDEGDAEQGGHENEQVDPHAQMEDNLELPEDMVMDGEKPVDDKFSDADSDFDDATEENALPDSKKEETDQNDQDDQDNAEDHDIKEAREPSESDHDASEPDEDPNSDIAMLDNEDDDQRDAHDGLMTGEDGTGQDQDAKVTNAKPSTANDVPPEDTEIKEENPGHGTEGGATRTEDTSTSNQTDQTGEEQQMSNLKQLGDILKQWYDQQREIQSAIERKDDDNNEGFENPDSNKAQFEHLPENVESEMQALGAASTEQSRALNDNSISVNETEPEDLPMPMDNQSEDQPDVDQESTAPVPNERIEEDADVSNSKAMIGTYTDFDMDMADAEEVKVDEGTELDDITAVDEGLTQTHISQETDMLSIDEARQIWAEHEDRTRNMAIVLTEHLRLILQPTLATKMRGDFRTGKRLNIKKIIPYIASSYKRDKIWMRRSVPSKRSYQIMLAIDDSKSMFERESKSLAFDTLCLVAKSLTMLEAGEICVVSFGKSVNIAHELNMPFTSEAGADVVRQFSFAQSKTDIRKLLETMIETFRTARMRRSGPEEQWQLQFIISDGFYDDGHASIRQLVRQAHEEQIMVVFIIIDSAGSSSSQGQDQGQGQDQSILDYKRATFVDGQPILEPYLSDFPFPYYLIVRDVQELPGVLGGALRQWFAEVAVQGSG